MKIFSLDGPFHKYGTIVFDLFLLNLLWLACVIITLGVGVGAATTALFYCVDKCIIRDRGYVVSGFLKSFKDNFIKATLAWIMIAIAASIILINLFALNLNSFPFGFVLIIINYVVLYQLVLITIYIFPLIAKVELGKTKQYFINAFKLSNGHMINSLTCVVVVFASCVIQYVVPPFILLAISVTAVLISRIIVGRVLKRYYTENDLEQ